MKIKISIVGNRSRTFLVGIRLKQKGNIEKPSPQAAGYSKKVRDRGFTLLELLIIIFVACISLSIVLLSAGRIHENTIFKGEVRTLHATLRYAREISLMERTNVTFDLDGEGKNKYWLAKNDHKEHEHVVPAGFSITGKAIAFFPKGNSSGGIIDLKDDKGREYRFEVDPVLGIASSKGVHSP